MIHDQTFEARIRRLEDRTQIQELAAKYAIALDDRDMEALQALLTGDARLRSKDGAMDLSGRDTVIEQLSIRMADTGPSNHVNHMHIIQFDDADQDAATGIVTAHAELWSGERALLAALRYEDVYRREAGHWRFASRMASYLYFLPVDRYGSKLGARERLLVRSPPSRADYPESLPSWRAFYGEP